MHDSGYYSKYDQQRLVQDSAYYSEMSRVFFSVWFSIQGIIQNTTCSMWFRIPRIIKKCPGYYSASGSVFSVLFGVLFKIRLAYYSASGPRFRVFLKKCPGYYSASSSVFSVLYRDLFKIRPAYYSAPCSGLRVLFKKFPGYYSASGLLKMARVLFSFWFSIQYVNMFKVSAYAVKTDGYAICSV